MELKISLLDLAGVLLGVQIGKRWYFKQQEKHAVGIMANWVDFSIARNRQSSSSVTNGLVSTRTSIDFSVLELGPIVSYKLNKNQTIDGYFNIRPTLMISSIRTNRGGTTTSASGLSFNIGFTYRHNTFHIGPEVVFGKLKNVNVFQPGDDNIAYEDSNINIRNVRLIAGFDF